MFSEGADRVRHLVFGHSHWAMLAGTQESDDRLQMDRMAATGRFEPDGLEANGRSGYEVAQYQHVGQLSYALLTLMRRKPPG